MLLYVSPRLGKRERERERGEIPRLGPKPREDKRNNKQSLIEQSINIYQQSVIFLDFYLSMVNRWNLSLVFTRSAVFRVVSASMVACTEEVVACTGEEVVVGGGGQVIKSNICPNSVL